MPQDLLSDSSSVSEDEGSDFQLTINEHFAKAYEYRKEREELAKLKEKYGSDAEFGSEDDSDSESDESEDEDGEELTPAVDVAILRTLARIKNKDPDIYESKRAVFDEEHKKSGPAPTLAARPKEKAAKPVRASTKRIADIVASSSDDEEDDRQEEHVPTHVEEQARLREETIAAFHANDADDDDAEGLLQLREKTQDEVALEEEEYRRYLEREVEGIDKLVEVEERPVEVSEEEKMEDMEPEAEDGKKKKRKKKKKKKGTEEKKQSDQEFLMNYILNRGWIDRSAKRLPTFDEVTRDPGTSLQESEPPIPTGANAGALGDDADDDEFDDVVDVFESSYNFRFEEPEAPVIPSFPRQVESVRRPTEQAERRKEARERRKERKEEEKNAKREEIRRLKNLKMKEMNEKLARIGKEGGWADTKALEDFDLDGDWDPDAYEKQMAAALREVEDADGGGAMDDEKPNWDDDIDIGDIAQVDDDEQPEAGPSNNRERKKEKKKEKKKRKKAADAAAEDEGGVDIDAMDADAPPVEASVDDEWDGTEEMRKQVLEKYMDEVYNLEFNDMVGGMPTRFKYAPVAPTSYGLSPVDILMADDRDLNEFMGLKKYAPYRKERDRWDLDRPQKLQKLKTKLADRGVYDAIKGGLSTREGQDKPEKKRKGKKERLKAKAEAEATGENGEEPGSGPAKRGRQDEEDNDARDEADGPAIKKRRRHRKAVQATAVDE